MQLRVAAYGVIVRDGAVLLARWRDRALGRSAWTLPGGGLEPGEAPEDAARREIREETGYDAALMGVLGVPSIVIPATDRHPGEGPLHRIGIVYRARIVGGALADEVGGTTDRAAWHRLEDVARLERVELVDDGLALAGLA